MFTLIQYCDETINVKFLMSKRLPSSPMLDVGFSNVTTWTDVMLVELQLLTTYTYY